MIIKYLLSEKSIPVCGLYQRQRHLLISQRSDGIQF